MSERWEFFACQMGESTAFIFFDDGIGDTIDGLQVQHLVKVRAALLAPNVRGLPADNEFAQLVSLEDRLTAFVTAAGGFYVGRITVNGARYFHFYVDVDEEELAAFLQQLESDTRYGLSYVRDADPERSGYWEELYPTADDRQVIKDMKVLEVLEKEGDCLETERRIDHWAYFDRAPDRETFVAWATANGYSIQARLEPEGERRSYGIQLFHVASPRLATITHHTIELRRKAAEMGGHYDGWETSVERAGDTGTV
jgi:hypothetical protein